MRGSMGYVALGCKCYGVEVAELVADTVFGVVVEMGTDVDAADAAGTVEVAVVAPPRGLCPAGVALAAGFALGS